MIHPAAVVGSDASLTDVDIGAFAIIGIDGDSDLPRTVIREGSLIRSHAVVYRGVSAGAGLHVGHGALIRELTTFGTNCSVGSHTIVEHRVTIGDGVRIHGNAFVPEFSVLQDGCWIGPCVTFTNAKHPNRPETKEQLKGVFIGEGAVVGAGAVLLPGITIGAGSTVGAGAVAVKDVPPGRTVVGNPASLV